MKAATIQFWARMQAARSFAEVQDVADWWVHNVCPTCTDSGMDEGVFCEDCEYGKRLARQAKGKS